MFFGITKHVTFSMTIKSVKIMHQCGNHAPKHLCTYGYSKIEIQQTEEGKQKRVKMERTVGMKKRIPDGLSVAQVYCLPRVTTPRKSR